MRFGTTSGVVALILTLQARAQTGSNATCSNGSSWMSNSLGQNPCVVAAYLAGVCTYGVFDILALPSTSNETYGPPDPTNATPCLCNTVAYSLIQACSYCQDNSLNSWSDWIGSGCPTAYTQARTFPYDVPAGTVIPPWAEIDPTVSGFWDPMVAEAYATSASASITPVVVSSTATASAATASAAIDEDHDKSIVGPIIGGVVGGLAGIALIAILLWYFLRKRLIKDERRISTTLSAARSSRSYPLSPVNDKSFQPGGSPTSTLAHLPEHAAEPWGYSNAKNTYVEQV